MLIDSRKLKLKLQNYSDTYMRGLIAEDFLKMIEEVEKEETKTYKFYIRKANPFTGGYDTDVRTIKTTSKFETVGKIYSTTIEKIERISYQEIKEQNKKQ